MHRVWIRGEDLYIFVVLLKSTHAREKENPKNVVRKSTIPAKLIMDTLQPFRENFPGGMLWQKLVKHFTAQAKGHEPHKIRIQGLIPHV